MTLSILFCLVTLDIMGLAMLELDQIYLILIIILIVIQLLVLLIIFSKFYHLCYLIEYDIKEYKIG